MRIKLVTRPKPTFYYIESFYNRRRLHSSLGYLSPDEYEQLFYQQQEVTFA